MLGYREPVSVAEPTFIKCTITIIIDILFVANLGYEGRFGLSLRRVLPRPRDIEDAFRFVLVKCDKRSS